jgi:hypothetical protein
MHDVPNFPANSSRGVAAWQELMRRGEYTAAWEISDLAIASRSESDQQSLPPHLRSVWDGTPVEGRRVLVRCNHGIGDTIQFARYIEPLRAAASEVTVCAGGTVIELLSRAPFVDDGVTLTTDADDVAFDVDGEIMELPHVFRTTLDTIPSRIPYLDVTPADIPRTTGPTVGLAWRSGEWDPGRSIAFDDLGPLFDMPGISFCSVQLNAVEAGWRMELGEMLDVNGLLRTAAVIRSLDLLISVDTMTAHLAGALGQPVWTLLKSDADWRWMDGPTSPWYPTMRLFRQERPGEWPPVIRRVAEDLAMYCT